MGLGIEFEPVPGAGEVHKSHLLAGAIDKRERRIYEVAHDLSPRIDGSLLYKRSVRLYVDQRRSPGLVLGGAVGLHNS